MELGSPSNGTHPTYSSFPEYADSASSTPDRSSSATISGGYFFSCPASPVHYVLSSSPYSAAAAAAAVTVETMSSSDEASALFEFDGGAGAIEESMISADELFLNGKIRPRRISTKWQQPLAPLVDMDGEDEEEGELAAEGCRGRDLRIRTRSRRTRSMSPVRSPRFNWQEESEDVERRERVTDREVELEDKPEETVMTPETPAPASDSSRSSSSSSSSSSTPPGKYARRWIFLKDFLHRSKSEGSGRGENGKEKEKFWHSISFSPSSFKSKPPLPPSATLTSPDQQKAKLKKAASSVSSPPPKKPSNGSGRRRQLLQGSTSPAPLSLHGRHYAANRAQAEEMRRRTFLPYRQGLLGCLTFGSRSYTVINGFAKTLNPVSSR